MRPLKSVPDAADMLGVKRNTLDIWRCEGRGPAFVRVGSRVMYRDEDLETFITANIRTSTSQEV